MTTWLDVFCIPFRLGGGVFVVARMCCKFVFPIVDSCSPLSLFVLLLENKYILGQDIYQVVAV